MERNPSPYQTAEYSRDSEDDDPKNKKKKSGLPGSRWYSLGNEVEAWKQPEKQDSLTEKEKKAKQAEAEAAKKRLREGMFGSDETDEEAPEATEKDKDDAAEQKEAADVATETAEAEPDTNLTKEEDGAVGLHLTNVSLAKVRQEVRAARPDSKDEVIATAHQALLIGTRRRISEGAATRQAAAEAYDEVAATLHQEQDQEATGDEALSLAQAIEATPKEDTAKGETEAARQKQQAEAAAQQKATAAAERQAEAENQQPEVTAEQAAAKEAEQEAAAHTETDELTEDTEAVTESVGKDKAYAEQQRAEEAEANKAEAADDLASAAAIAEALLARREDEHADEARKAAEEDLEQDVADINSELVGHEQRIRQLAEAASGDQSSHQVRRMARRLHQMSTTQQTTAEAHSEAGPGAAEYSPNEYARMPGAGEQPLTKEAAAQQVEQLSTQELLAIADTIMIDKVPLRRMYEAHSFSEQSLRRLVAEHARGHDIREMLAHELLDKELRFELDPTLHQQLDTLDASSSPQDAATAFEAANRIGRTDVGADGMTPQERATVRYEETQLAKTEQLHTRLNVMFGAAFVLLAVIIVILLLQR